ncbi:uncharacterized protein LOC131214157 [Anopheles bellator]|uniref:uncharacterized protein LOC131214157 n=1 Tax=Anopheles bellator TaxID=139047 RepID=UPI002649DFBF|nr:uncharacterized protein LOC131214157 [Anopheles bellator]
MWLYISRLAPSVTDEQVASMVTNCLGSGEYIVKRLLRKDADTATLSFLSFKVGLPETMRHKALQPTTWPSGVQIREFVDYHAHPSAPLTELEAPLNPMPYLAAMTPPLAVNDSRALLQTAPPTTITSAPSSVSPLSPRQPNKRQRSGRLNDAPTD